MDKRTATINALAEQNIAEVMRNGPRLRVGQNTWVIARRPGEVLIGGLGCMGIGSMWFKERPEHQDLPGYEGAEVVSGDVG